MGAQSYWTGESKEWRINPHQLSFEVAATTQRARATSFTGKSVTQDTAYPQSLMKCAEKYGVSHTAGSTAQAGRTSILKARLAGGLQAHHRHPLPLLRGMAQGAQPGHRPRRGRRSHHHGASRLRAGRPEVNQSGDRPPHGHFR